MAPVDVAMYCQAAIVTVLLSAVFVDSFKNLFILATNVCMRVQPLQNKRSAPLQLASVNLTLEFGHA